MKSFWAILIFAVTFDCTQATLVNETNYNFTSLVEPEYEKRPMNCTAEKTMLELRVCLTKFIQKLRKDPTSDCSRVFEKYIECDVKAQTCSMMSSKYYEKEISNPHTRVLYSRSKFCDKAGQQYIITNSSDYADLEIDVCNRPVLYRPFVIKYNNCSEKLVKWWKVNKADKRLCSEFTNVKVCQENAFKETCQDHGGLHNLTLIQVRITGSNYNPFCPDGVNPTPRSISTMNWSSCSLVIMSLLYFLSTLSVDEWF